MRVSDGRVLGFGQAAILLGSHDPGAIPVLPTASRAGTRELIIFTRIANRCCRPVIKCSDLGTEGIVALKTQL